VSRSAIYRKPAEIGAADLAARWARCSELGVVAQQRHGLASLRPATAMTAMLPLSLRGARRRSNLAS
jgi:hypothetical protein